MRKIILISALLVLFLPHTRASHIMGGEITYGHISGNTYVINLNIYRNCYDPQLGYPDPMWIRILDNVGNNVDTLIIDFPGADTITTDGLTDTCIRIPPDVCIEEAIYQDTVTFDSIPTGGIHMYAQTFARNKDIINIENADDYGATFYAFIPDSSVYIDNNSPRFNDFPPRFVCVDEPFSNDQSALDPDGDSLVYTLCTPYNASNNFFDFAQYKDIDKALDPDAPATFPGGQLDTVPWYTSDGYSLHNLLGAGIPLQINSNTGQLTALPQRLGNFAVGICVSEYRNDTLISHIIRDFQFIVAECRRPSADIFASFNSIVFCSDSGITVNFPNNSQNATTYFWDFGDTTTFGDTSTVFSPSYEYEDTGVYNITLIVDKGTQCTDTAMVDINVFPTFEAGFTFSPNANCVGDTFYFVDSSNSGANSSIVSWLWEFGDGFFDSIQHPNHAYDDSGTYFVELTITSDKGCMDSVIDTVVVFSLPIANAGDNDTICLGGTAFLGDTLSVVGGNPPYAYSWSPATLVNNPAASNPISSPPADTFLVLTVTDSNGCIDMDTSRITVLPLPNAHADAGMDLSVCMLDSIQIGGSPTASNGTPPYTYLWEADSVLDDSSLANPTALIDENTLFALLVTDTNGCEDRDTVLVEVFELPLADAGVDDSICDGASILLGGMPSASNGTTPYSYRWSPGLNLNDSTIANPISTPIDSTEYILLVTDSNFCQDQDTVLIMLKMDPAVFAEAGTTDTLCLGDSVTLGGSPTALGGTAPYMYHWSSGNLLSDSTSSNPTTSPSSDTTLFYLSITDVNLCKATDSILIITVPSPIADAGNVMDTICLLDSLLIGGNPSATNGTAPYTFAWTPNTAISDTALSNPSVFPSTDRAYSLTVTDVLGCSDMDSITIFIDTLPIPIVSNDTSLCDGFTANLRVSGGDFYLWQPSFSLDSDTSATPLATPAATTRYQVFVTDLNGCSDTTSILVVVNPNPVIEAGENKIMDLGEEAQLDGSSDILVDYFWSPRTNISSTSIATPIVDPKETTWYYLQGVTDSGCIGLDSVMVLIADPMVEIPSAFTPNCDCDNARIKLISQDLAEVTLKIFNRWGELVFETQDPDEAWDGTHRGKQAAMDSYVYFIEGVSLTGDPVFKKGSITLLR